MIPEEYYIYASKVYSYNPNTGLFNRKLRTAYCTHIGQDVGSMDEKGYIRLSVTLNGIRKKLKAHRLAWFITHREIVEQIDHITHNKGDNRLSNLRAATNSLNQRNTKIRSNNTSGCRGVTFDKSKSHFNPWRANITIDKRLINLGHFKSKDEAIRARLLAEEKYWSAEGFLPSR